MGDFPTFGHNYYVTVNVSTKKCFACALAQLHLLVFSIFVYDGINW